MNADLSKENLRARLKKEIIQNNIYGVDIEEGAIEIARLRFWLSLVIDLDTPEPLPNFDYKFMQGNSLLESYEGIALSNLSAMKKKRKKEVSCDLFGKVEGVEKDTIYLSDTMFGFDLQKAIKDYFAINDHNQKQAQKTEIDEYLKCVICHTLSVKAVELNGTISNLKAVDNLKPKQQKVLEETEAEYNRLQDIIKNFHSAICDKFFLWHLWFKDVFDKGGFDIVIGNPPYGATLSDKDKAFFKEHYVTAKTIKEDPKKNIVGQKGSLNTYTLFIELAYNIGCNDGSISMIVPLSITSSKSVDVTQKWIFNNCRDFHVSSYAVRPQPVFKNAVVDVSIISFIKGAGSDNKIYSTKMYRKSKKDEKFSLQNLINNLEFIDVQDHLLIGRIPKIGKEIEKSILTKLKQNAQPLSAYIVDDDKGLPVYYRSAGGRYYKVVTPYPTYSSAETSITVEANMRDCICCILSSSLSFWFYQIYSDNLNWKPYEILETRIPNISEYKKQQIEALYQRYLTDIKNNVKSCENHGGNSYKVKTFDVYYIRKSLSIIDEIDDLIGPLYGLTLEEIDFIKNYERTFREDDDE